MAIESNKKKGIICFVVKWIKEFQLFTQYFLLVLDTDIQNNLALIDEYNTIPWPSLILGIVTTSPYRFDTCMTNTFKSGNMKSTFSMVSSGRIENLVHELRLPGILVKTLIIIP